MCIELVFHTPWYAGTITVGNVSIHSNARPTALYIFLITYICLAGGSNGKQSYAAYKHDENRIK